MTDSQLPPVPALPNNAPTHSETGPEPAGSHYIAYLYRLAREKLL